MKKDQSDELKMFEKVPMGGSLVKRFLYALKIEKEEYSDYNKPYWEILAQSEKDKVSQSIEHILKEKKVPIIECSMSINEIRKEFNK